MQLILLHFSSDIRKFESFRGSVALFHHSLHPLEVHDLAIDVIERAFRVAVETAYSLASEHVIVCTAIVQLAGASIVHSIAGAVGRHIISRQRSMVGHLLRQSGRRGCSGLQMHALAVHRLVLLLHHMVGLLLAGVRGLSVRRVERRPDHLTGLRAHHALVQTVVDALSDGSLIERHDWLHAHRILDLLELGFLHHGALARDQRRSKVLRVVAGPALATRSGKRVRVNAAVLLMVNELISRLQQRDWCVSRVLSARVVGRIQRAHELNRRLLRLHGLHRHLVVGLLGRKLLMLRRSHRLTVRLLLEAVDLLVDAAATVRHDLMLLRGQHGLRRADGRL